MSWFTPAANLSPKAEELLTSIVNLCMAEASAVAELLNEVAQANAHRNPVPDLYLVESAQELMNWAAYAIRYLGGKPDFPVLVNGQYFAEDPEHPLRQWQIEAESDLTRKGYWEWVEMRKESK